MAAQVSHFSRIANQGFDTIKNVTPDTARQEVLFADLVTTGRRQWA